MKMRKVVGSALNAGDAGAGHEGYVETATEPHDSP